MQAMKVRRLSDSPRSARLFLDGKRVSRTAWNAAHFGRRTDTYASRMFTRRDGAECVREFHYIRANKE